MSSHNVIARLYSLPSSSGSRALLASTEWTAQTPLYSNVRGLLSFGNRSSRWSNGSLNQLLSASSFSRDNAGMTLGQTL